MTLCGVQFLPYYLFIDPNSTIPLSGNIETVFYISFAKVHVLHNLKEINNYLITIRQPYTRALPESPEMNTD